MTPDDYVTQSLAFVWSPICTRDRGTRGQQERTAVSPRPDRCKGANRQFTLVELLVVIAVIGILVSMLLPALAQARGKGHQANCLSNCKQLILASHMYHDEYNMFQRHCANDGGTSGYDFCWLGVILTYHNSRPIEICPVDKSGMSYGIDLRGIDWKNTKAFRYPSEKMFFSEHDAHGGYYLRYQTCCTGAGALDSHIAGHGEGNPNHGRGNNVAYVDGHVQWLSVPQAIDWTSPCRLWNL